MRLIDTEAILWATPAESGIRRAAAPMTDFLPPSLVLAADTALPATADILRATLDTRRPKVVNVDSWSRILRSSSSGAESRSIMQSMGYSMRAVNSATTTPINITICNVKVGSL